MSLYGYKPTTKPALWTSVRGAKPVRALVRAPKVAKPRKAVRRRSKVRDMQMREYVLSMLAFLEFHPYCALCGNTATCVHHWAGRRGKQLLVQKDWRASCGACNQWAKDHPAEARLEGWLAPVGVYVT